MTVLAWDGISLAADKQASEGGLRHSTTKVKRIEKGRFKGYLIGAAGHSTQCNTMMAWFELGADPGTFPRHQDSDDFGAQLLAIAPDKTILRFDFNALPVVFHDKMYALGDGRDLALGAMMMGADAVRAVEIASSMNCYCGMGVDVLPLKPKRKR